VGANVARHAGEGILVQDPRQSLPGCAAGDAARVARDVLADRARLRARGGDAVEEGEPRRDLGQAVREVALPVPRRGEGLLRGPIEGCELVLRQLIQVPRPAGAHCPFQVLQPPAEAGVPPWLEEVGRRGDGAGSTGEDRWDVHAIGPSSVGHGEIAPKLPGEAPEEGHRDRVQGPPGHVDLVPGKGSLVVGHGQGVGELDPEGQPFPAGHSVEGRDELHRPVVRKVMAEHAVRDRDLPEPKAIMEDPEHLLLAEEGRVQLDERVEAPLHEEVTPDLLDLVRWAAVHR